MQNPATILGQRWAALWFNLLLSFAVNKLLLITGLCSLFQWFNIQIGDFWALKKLKKHLNIYIYIYCKAIGVHIGILLPALLFVPKAYVYPLQN